MAIVIGPVALIPPKAPTRDRKRIVIGAPPGDRISPTPPIGNGFAMDSRDSKGTVVANSGGARRRFSQSVGEDFVHVFHRDESQLLPRLGGNVYKILFV